MSSRKMTLPPRLPLLLVGDCVLMPGSSKRIKVSTPRNMRLVKEYLLQSASLGSTIIGIIPDTLDPPSSEEIPEHIHRTGTAAIVVQVTGTNWPKPNYTMLAHGLCRFTVDQIIRDTPYISAKVSQIGKWPSEPDDARGTDGTVSELASQLRKDALELVEALDMSVPVVSRLRQLLDRLPDHSLPDVLAAIVRSSTQEKLKILDAMDLEERLRRAIPLIMRQLESIKFIKGKNPETKKRDSESRTLNDDVQDVIIIRGADGRKKDGERKFRITPIQRDGKMADEDEDELQLLEKKIDSVGLSQDALKVAKRELKRLRKLPTAMPEHALTRNYVELLVDLPWNSSSNDKLDLNQAKLDLDVDHYSMNKLKRRVLEYLAVRQLQSNKSKQNVKGPILCFVGPPGVGKTSVGRSIAKTLGRKFHRISLGGVCDQSDIRGHRRTYVGSMPGRIINGLKTVGVNNPVFLLDEVDKLGKGLQGDPGAALLEVLDPEQNHTFVDHYLNVPFDLSSVLFIATANSINSIPTALLDRMEVIEVPGYTQEEKMMIARRHLLPKQLRAHGLPASNDEDLASNICITLTDDGLRNVIALYTREAGVRDLDRKLAGICRSIALTVANHDTKNNKVEITIDEAELNDILGPQRFDRESAQILTRPGVAAGLAWTQTGGEILYVEASRMASCEGGEAGGHMTLTGQLGDVMKESAQLAVSWLRSNAQILGVDDGGRSIMRGTDIHLHFPAGAVGKDGPSAGVTIVTALVSLFTGKLVRSDLAMTGEITLRGLVLPVGGIKEKVLAAHRAGMRRVVLPRRNEPDARADLPAEVLKSMSIRFVDYLEDVLSEALDDGEIFGNDKIPSSKL
ncbi:lon protease homolog 2, peroxisomal-like isoform X1 [Ciona intestinalis]